MFIVNYQAIRLTTFPSAPPPPDPDGNDYNDWEDNNHKDNPQEASIMSKTTTKMAAAAAATAAAAKKTATTKTTGKAEANYLLTAPSVCPVLKNYSLGTNNKFAMSYDTQRAQPTLSSSSST
jgi:hypothetical protein